MQADDKMVLAGECWDGVVGYQFCVARLNANGTLDATFVGLNQNGAGRALSQIWAWHGTKCTGSARRENCAIR
jgi:hypothetical protein